MFNKSLGDRGESAAAEYLKKLGYRILKLKFTTNLGEIDIVAEDTGTIAFIEVKTRLTDRYGLPREAVSRSKQKKYGMMAMQYIKINRCFDRNCRFDVVEVTSAGINHIKNAFDYIR